MTNPITITAVDLASPEPSLKFPSPTIPLVRALAKAARSSRAALHDLRQIAAGQNTRRDLHQVRTHQHVLLANEKDAETKYGFSIHHTYKRISKVSQGSRAIRRLAAREVERYERRVQTENRRKLLFGQLLVQTADEPPITLTPEDAVKQTEILRKLGRTPSPKRPLTKPPLSAVNDMAYDAKSKKWVKPAAKGEWSERVHLASPEPVEFTDPR